MRDNDISGIVGGMGYYATNFFIRRIIELTGAKKEWDNPNIIVHYNPTIPSRTRALLYGEESPADGTINCINNLTKLGVKRVYIPCNSMHYWYKEVSRKISIPWVNLLKSIKADGKSLILGAYATIKMGLYDKYLDTIYLSRLDEKKVYNLIEMLKVNETQIIKKELHKILKNYCADNIILACTELSMAFSLDEKEFGGKNLIDSTTEYASRFVLDVKGE